MEIAINNKIYFYLTEKTLQSHSNFILKGAFNEN